MRTFLSSVYFGWALFRGQEQNMLTSSPPRLHHHPGPIHPKKHAKKEISSLLRIIHWTSWKSNPRPFAELRMQSALPLSYTPRLMSFGRDVEMVWLELVLGCCDASSRSSASRGRAECSPMSIVVKKNRVASSTVRQVESQTPTQY